MRIELMTPGLQDQCSSHWAMKPFISVLELLDSDLSQLRQRTTLSRLGRCNRWQPMNMEVRGEVERERWQSKGKKSLSAGFEPARAEPNRFLVYRLNHSATTTCIQRAQDTDQNWGYFTDTITRLQEVFSLNYKLLLQIDDYDILMARGPFIYSSAISL